MSIQNFLIRERPDGTKIRLKPVKVDDHTWVLLPVEKATPEEAAKRRQAMIESRKLAIGGLGKKNFKYEDY